MRKELQEIKDNFLNLVLKYLFDIEHNDPCDTEHLWLAVAVRSYGIVGKRTKIEDFVSFEDESEREVKLLEAVEIVLQKIHEHNRL